MKVIELMEHLKTLPPYDEIGITISGSTNKPCKFEETLVIEKSMIKTRNAKKEE